MISHLVRLRSGYVSPQAMAELVRPLPWKILKLKDQGCDAIYEHFHLNKACQVHDWNLLLSVSANSYGGGIPEIYWTFSAFWSNLSTQTKLSKRRSDRQHWSELLWLMTDFLCCEHQGSADYCQSAHAHDFAIGGSLICLFDQRTDSGIRAEIFIWEK